MHGRKLVIGAVLALLLPAGSALAAVPPAPAQQFFDGLRALCGARFEGAMSFPADSDDFAGKLLVATFESCTEDELRVPFLVGEDSSRTWIFRRVDGGLLLKHDHRHADGTPDEVTMYGGMAAPGGSASSQSFHADADTARMIPDAATNVWTLSLDASAETLTYHLERHGQPRFTAVLKRIRPSDPAAEATAPARGLAP